MERRILLYALPSNPDLLLLTHTDIVVASVVKACGFGVGMSGHALRDFDASAVREIVRYPCRPERMAAYRGFNTGIRSAATHHLPDIRA